MDGSLVNGKCESILFPFSLAARPNFKLFNEPASMLFREVNKDKIGGMTFYSEDDDGNEVNLITENSMLTAILKKF